MITGLRDRTRETANVDSANQFEETNTMIGILCKILVDHVQSDIKYGLEDNWDLVVQKGLCQEK